MRSWCTPRTAGRTLGSSPGTAGGTRAASSPQPRCCPPSPPDPEATTAATKPGQLSSPQKKAQEARCRRAGPTHLLVFGDRVEQLDVQLGVVLRQRLVAVVVDELHHRAEGERVGEAVLALPVEDLDQLVVASFPAGGAKKFRRSSDLPQRSGSLVCKASGESLQSGKVRMKSAEEEKETTPCWWGQGGEDTSS